MMPPSVLRIHIADRGKRVIRLWLPVFLLWPFMGVLGVLLPVLLLILRAKALEYNGIRLRPALPAIYSVICELKGLRIHVSNEGVGTDVLIRID